MIPVPWNPTLTSYLTDSSDRPCYGQLGSRAWEEAETRFDSRHRLLNTIGPLAVSSGQNWATSCYHQLHLLEIVSAPPWSVLLRKYRQGGSEPAVACLPYLTRPVAATAVLNPEVWGNRARTVLSAKSTSLEPDGTCLYKGILVQNSLASSLSVPPF